jgi:hypothetical protein
MFFQFKPVRFESVIPLLIIPLSIATLVGGVYFLLHVDFQSVVIPDWYKEEPFEAMSLLSTGRVDPLPLVLIFLRSHLALYLCSISLKTGLMEN